MIFWGHDKLCQIIEKVVEKGVIAILSQKEDYCVKNSTIVTVPAQKKK